MAQLLGICLYYCSSSVFLVHFFLHREDLEKIKCVYKITKETKKTKVKKCLKKIMVLIKYFEYEGN